MCVCVVLLGVLDPRVGDPSFQAKMERQLAQLLGEAMGTVRRVKRATTVGNSSVQVLPRSPSLPFTSLIKALRIAFTEYPNPVHFFFLVRKMSGSWGDEPELLV